MCCVQTPWCRQMQRPHIHHNCEIWRDKCSKCFHVIHYRQSLPICSCHIRWKLPSIIYWKVVYLCPADVLNSMTMTASAIAHHRPTNRTPMKFRDDRLMRAPITVHRPVLVVALVRPAMQQIKRKAAMKSNAAQIFSAIEMISCKTKGKFGSFFHCRFFGINTRFAFFTQMVSAARTNGDWAMDFQRAIQNERKFCSNEKKVCWSWHANGKYLQLLLTLTRIFLRFVSFRTLSSSRYVEKNKKDLNIQQSSLKDATAAQGTSQATLSNSN